MMSVFRIRLAGAGLTAVLTACAATTAFWLFREQTSVALAFAVIIGMVVVFTGFLITLAAEERLFDVQASGNDLDAIAELIRASDPGDFS